MRLGLKEGLDDVLGQRAMLMGLGIVEQCGVVGLLPQLQSLINEAIHRALAEAMLVQLDDQVGVLKLLGALSGWEWLGEGKELGFEVACH